MYKANNDTKQNCAFLFFRHRECMCENVCVRERFST